LINLVLKYWLSWNAIKFTRVETWNLNLRIMSWTFYHCKTRAQCKNINFENTKIILNYCFNKSISYWLLSSSTVVKHSTKHRRFSEICQNRYHGDARQTKKLSEPYHGDNHKTGIVLATMLNVFLIPSNTNQYQGIVWYW